MPIEQERCERIVRILVIPGSALPSQTMDLHMPEPTGIEATRRLVESSPHVGVLVLTMVEEDNAVFAAMRAGARGYLLKGSNQAGSSTRSGPSAPVRRSSGRLAQRLIEFFSTSPSGPPQAFPAHNARAGGARS